mmetsp:Transcript_59894/g.129878  ORF Transcript_59894/g.129878 Transcript_59894/m.129878 type:complete len:377 (-) Transcript_59894:124-1254(-)
MGCRLGKDHASFQGAGQPLDNASVGSLAQAKETNLDEDRALLSELQERNVMFFLGRASSSSRRFSIGSFPDYGKSPFAEKAIKEIGEVSDDLRLGLGFACRRGTKNEGPNQDSWFAMRVEDEFSLYAVFDGHGQKGHDISDYVKDFLPKLILRDPRFESRTDMPDVCRSAFVTMQRLVSIAHKSKRVDAVLSGTTASLAIHCLRENKLHLAHVADSTVVLGHVQDGKPEASYLTRDHRPDLEDERTRIEDAGGCVVFDGYANHRIFDQGLKIPGLNMSRCIGDLMAHKECGVSCVPEVLVHELAPQDKVLLVCSDGVWEFMSAIEAVELVSKFKPHQAAQAADALAREAWDRWIKEEGGTTVDDITVVCAYFFSDL